MTFTELASARGTSKRAAVVLVRRHGWRKQRNNAGHVLALVPPTWAVPAAEAVPGHEDDDRAGHSEGHDARHSAPFHARALTALEDAVTVLREQLVRAEARADSERSRADAALALADQTLAQLADAETAIGTERQRADAMRDRVAVLQAQADTAEATARDLRQAERLEHPPLPCFGLM